VGELSDLAARKLNLNGVGRMFCLAGVGGRVSGILEKTRAANRILAIDGCPLDCARQTLEGADIRDFAHLRVTDLGMEKGMTIVARETVDKVAERAASLLNGDVR
jgi:uncharacterized metal-binding protein